MYGERIEHWERRVEWPLMAAAVIFFVAYAVEILARTPQVEQAAEAVIWATWAVFLVDYVVRLVLAERRGRWFVRHLLDLAIIVLPTLRPLRLMRFLTIVSLIGRGAGNLLRGRVLLYTVVTTGLVVVIAALAVYDEERDVGNIRSFGDAVWWAFCTITTVGYGDYFPVTVIGRIVAVGLMVCGVALIGVVTATLASWIVERVADREKPIEVATELQVELLRVEVAELKAMIEALTADASASAPRRVSPTAARRHRPAVRGRADGARMVPWRRTTTRRT